MNLREAAQGIPLAVIQGAARPVKAYQNGCDAARVSLTQAGSSVKPVNPGTGHEPLAEEEALLSKERDGSAAKLTVEESKAVRVLLTMKEAPASLWGGLGGERVRRSYSIASTGGPQSSARRKSAT
jgi:hypothetical protein